MEFEVIFYRDNQNKSPIEEFLLELGKSNTELIAKTKQGIEKLRNRFYHKEPLSKYIEPKLWEARIKAGNSLLRIFYTYKKGRVIILLHIFVKKEQKTPTKELEVARNRLKEISRRHNRQFHLIKVTADENVIIPRADQRLIQKQGAGTVNYYIAKSVYEEPTGAVFRLDNNGNFDNLDLQIRRFVRRLS